MGVTSDSLTHSPPRCTHSHPGCECPTGITGDRCEINLDKSDNKATPSTVGDGDGDSGVKGLGIAAIILSVCAICAVSMFALRGCFRRRTFSKRSGVVEKSSLMWSDKSFKDNVESVNFSPHRNSSSVDDGYMASFASPSRDPMATAFAPEPYQSSYSDASTGKPDIDDEPQIFIGPPRVSTFLCATRHFRLYSVFLIASFSFTGRGRARLAQCRHHLIKCISARIPNRIRPSVTEKRLLNRLNT